MLLEQLQFIPRVEAVKPLPWRQSLTPNRRMETIRPIFWANRTKSYLSRTENWDEYPNGRFGDSRSPAYGEIPYDIKLPRDTAYQVWGHPETGEEIGQLFANFCRGKVASLPWSEDAPAPETGVIFEHLARLNESGFLTINSQPAVNGAPSNDPVHGWGPGSGYVYQKAYLEFFVSPAGLTSLLAQIERDPLITYYAINKRGDLRTNTHSEGPNAVTWGVFPGKEIVQPTVVEAISFMAWKDEAFELGMQWAHMYEPSSPTYRLLVNMMETYYLVNVVHNNIKDQEAIFQPFYRAAQSKKAAIDIKYTNGINGHA